MKNRQSILLFICILAITLSLNAQQDSLTIPKAPTLEDYNFIIGTQAISGKYKFTDQHILVEQAAQIRAMGSNILKISLGKNYPVTYKIKKDSTIQTTLDLIKKKKAYKKVLDMDFKYIMAWVHTLTEAKWGDGLTFLEEKQLYQEMYDLTVYLLQTYNNSGKTFMLGNWEGDWLLNGEGKSKKEPSDEKLQAMIDWMNLRQKAIDDAKKATPHENVTVFHYVEVNLVIKGIRGKKCFTSHVLPEINPDLVSYSAYEAIYKNTYKKIKGTLNRTLNYIESQLQKKKGIPFQRRVFIGEYGYTIQKNTPQQQKERAHRVILAAVELDVPFVLYWQMYNNVYRPQLETKGFSLISEAGYKKPVYHLHADFYKKMNNYLKEYKAKNGIYPKHKEFKKEAIAVLNEL